MENGLSRLRRTWVELQKAILKAEEFNTIFPAIKAKKRIRRFKMEDAGVDEFRGIMIALDLTEMKYAKRLVDRLPGEFKRSLKTVEGYFSLGVPLEYLICARELYKDSMAECADSLKVLRLRRDRSHEELAQEINQKLKEYGKASVISCTDLMRMEMQEIEMPWVILKIVRQLDREKSASYLADLHKEFSLQVEKGNQEHDFAVSIGMSRCSLWQMEKGKKTVPTDIMTKAKDVLRGCKASSAVNQSVSSPAALCAAPMMFGDPLLALAAGVFALGMMKGDSFLIKALRIIEGNLDRWTAISLASTQRDLEIFSIGVKFGQIKDFYEQLFLREYRIAKNMIGEFNPDFSPRLILFLEWVFQNMFVDREYRNNTQLVFLRAGAEPLADIAWAMSGTLPGIFHAKNIHSVWATMSQYREMCRDREQAVIFVKYLYGMGVLTPNVTRIFFVDTDTGFGGPSTELIILNTLFNKEVIVKVNRRFGLDLPVWSSDFNASHRAEMLYMACKEMTPRTIQYMADQAGISAAEYGKIKVRGFINETGHYEEGSLWWTVDQMPKVEYLQPRLLLDAGGVAIVTPKDPDNQKHSGLQQHMNFWLQRAGLVMGTLDMLESEGVDVSVYAKEWIGRMESSLFKQVARVSSPLPGGSLERNSENAGKGATSSSAALCAAPLAFVDPFTLSAVEGLLALAAGVFALGMASLSSAPAVRISASGIKQVILVDKPMSILQAKEELAQMMAGGIGSFRAKLLNVNNGQALYLAPNPAYSDPLLFWGYFVIATGVPEQNNISIILNMGLENRKLHLSLARNYSGDFVILAKALIEIGFPADLVFNSVAALTLEKIFSFPDKEDKDSLTLLHLASLDPDSVAPASDRLQILPCDIAVWKKIIHSADSRSFDFFIGKEYLGMVEVSVVPGANTVNILNMETSLRGAGNFYRLFEATQSLLKHSLYKKEEYRFGEVINVVNPIAAHALIKMDWKPKKDNKTIRLAMGKKGSLPDGRTPVYAGRWRDFVFMWLSLRRLGVKDLKVIKRKLDSIPAGEGEQLFVSCNYYLPGAIALPQDLLPKERLLILEDRPEHLQKLLAVYRGKFKQIFTAWSLDEAREMIEKYSPFDLVISDLDLSSKLIYRDSRGVILTKFATVLFNGEEVPIRRAGEAFVLWVANHLLLRPKIIVLHSSSFEKWSRDYWFAILT
ncbi:MAG: hypothetical protein NT060_00415, partial [Candidatus Omnitrophica bacterium]|nr:hypothetical protein [Candidatus Omnitrophota bacterium]